MFIGLEQVQNVEDKKSYFTNKNYIMLRLVIDSKEYIMDNSSDVYLKDGDYYTRVYDKFIQDKFEVIASSPSEDFII